MDHLADSFHDLVPGDERGTVAHEVGNGFAVTGTLEDLGRDQCDGLRVVQLEAAVAAAAGEIGGNDDQQFLLFARGEMHGSGCGKQDERTAEGDDSPDADLAVPGE